MIQIRAATTAELKFLGHGDKASGYAFIMLHDGKIIGAGGIACHPKQPTQGHAWTFHVEHSKFAIRQFHKWVKILFPIVKENFERIEAFTWPDTPHCRWLQYFGFESEGLSRKYYKGQDFARFAWVKP